MRVAVRNSPFDRLIAEAMMKATLLHSDQITYASDHDDETVTQERFRAIRIEFSLFFSLSLFPPASFYCMLCRLTAPAGLYFFSSSSSRDMIIEKSFYGNKLDAFCPSFPMDEEEERRSKSHHHHRAQSIHGREFRITVHWLTVGAGPDSPSGSHDCCGLHICYTTTGWLVLIQE